jgi:methionine-rich copper-binding protein CopC
VDAIGSGSSTTRYWEYNTGATNGGVLGSIAVGYERAYVGATNSHLYCLDSYGSGGSTTVYWDEVLSPVGTAGICASPAITPKYVFVSTTGNAMHCRNRTNGNHIWSNTFTPSGMYGMCSSPAVYKDRVLCASDNGNLYVIKPIIDLIPPHVQSTTPTDSAINVGLMDNISVKFDEVIDIETLTTSSLILKDSQDNTVTGTISSDMSIETAYFTPDEPFLKEETYTFTVTTDIMDLKKNTLDGNGNNLMEGPGVDEYTISFTTIPFYSPTIGSIPTLKPVEDVPFNRNLSGSINDLDTPKYDLTLTENTSYGSLDGFELNLLYPNGVTSDKINLTVSDGLFTVYKHIDVAVTPVNDPPEITELSTLGLTEDVTHTINLMDQVSDIDTPFSQLSFYENSSYGRVEDMYFNLTYPEGITYEYVNLTVFDEDYSDSTEILITIEPVNDPPEIDTLPPVTVKEDTPFELSLETFISDVDTPQNELEIIVESANVEVTGFTLTLTYNERIGTDTLDVKVFDGEYYDNATLEVTVDPINHPPVIVKIISPLEGDVYEHDDSIDFQAEVDDEDLAHGDTLTYLWHDLKKGDIAETQNAMDIVLAPGEHFISFVVTDDFGGRATANVNITVKEKPTPVTPPDNTTNTTGDGDSDDDDDDKKEGSSLAGLLMMAGIGIVIVIIILAIIGLVIMKRKKKVTEDPTLAQQAQAQAVQMQMPQQTYQQYPDMAQQQLLMQQFAQAPGQVQAPAVDPSLFYGPMPGDTTGIDPSLLYGPSYGAPAPAIDSSLQYPQLPPSTDSQPSPEQTTEAIEGEFGTTESPTELQQLPEQLTTPEPTGPQLNVADQIDPNDPLQQARTFDLPVSETTSLDTSTSTAKDENKDSESNTESG